jgi:hypothetical protein
MTPDTDPPRRGRPKKTGRPSIPLPGGDSAEPVGRMGREVGMAERPFREWCHKHGVHISLHAGCSYVSRNTVLAVLAEEITGEAAPKRRRRR